MNQDASFIERSSARCCIAGGGPAGIVLGFLLARAGVETIVLEKHADYLRDFRGDTIHPSTLQIMYELGLLDEFLRRPHNEYRQVAGQFGDLTVTVADFSHLPTRCKFIALMPQWDFLNFITECGERYPAFHLAMQHEVTDIIEEDGRVVGLRGTNPKGPFEVRADLCVGADGRHSVVREKARLPILDLGAPIDVLWMRASKRADDPDPTLGRFKSGGLLVTINRGDYWQCAYVITKGSFDQIRERGLPAFRAALVDAMPALRDRVEELKDWKDVSLLTVRVDRLRQWSRPGLLCLGDSAHAMSPVGGVGINLAIQDAVAAANILAGPLVRREVTLQHLNQLQRRREFPTRMTQAAQVFVHTRFLKPLLESGQQLATLPLPVKLLRSFPVLRRIPARLIGMGVRPEHVKTPDVQLSR